MAEATRFPDLNTVLRDFVDSVRSILDQNFYGAYLQGSFAVGDADEHSDVDFIVVTEREVSDVEVAALEAMHRRILRGDVPWAQHLEGSYAPRDRVRRVDPSRSAFLFLDNGASRLEWDNHCNTAVVRWVLREHAIVLAGPEPTTFIDPVPAAEVRREILAAMPEWVEWAPAPTKAGRMSRWKQAYLVLSFCRMLHTLDSGRLASKQQAGEWALATLAGEWRSLIRRAIDDRPDPWARVHQPADPEDAQRTLAFVDYAFARARASETARPG